jgi:hypothetical protein
MGLRTFLGATLVALAFVFVGCSTDKAQKVEPETRGKRGERCMARNDCDSGLACLNGVCAKNEFAIDVSAKQCDRIECTEDVDCCGDRPTKAPAKCKNRDVKCDPENQLLPGCVQTSCAATGACGGGGVCTPGTCNIVGGACMAASDCLDTCAATGFCTKSTTTACELDTDCLYYTYNTQAACNNRTCNCQNPEYDPFDPICTDEDCDPSAVCLLRCQDELCLKDNSCETATDCLAIGLPICDDGRCVQCTEDAECDEDENETCENGQCQKPCEHDEECGLFEACNAGECVYVGCNDDKECILAAARGLEGVGGSNGGGISSGGDDPRLFKCLPSEADATINTCKIPCENDGSCGQFQVCDKGYCKFIGCDTDEQCRAYLGIANQQTSETKPYVATAVCRE